MPDPRISDEDLLGLTRAYLTSRRGQPAPRDLEMKAVNFAFTRRRSRLVAIVGTSAFVIAGALLATVVLAFHTGERSGTSPGGNEGTSALHIVRHAGSLSLPGVDRTIHDSQAIAKVAGDIRDLPSFPADERCPASFGTYYSLTFAIRGAPPWTALIGAQGCETVQVSGQPVRWAVHQPELWKDLGKAFGLSVDQLLPPVCLGTASPSNCAPITTRWGTVSGDAFRCEGIPIAGAPPVEVDAFSGPTLVDSTTASASGAYRMTLVPGTYTIRVPANPEHVVTVTLQPGGSAEADFPNTCK